MKHFGVLSLLAVLVSCGGSSGGGGNNGGEKLDPYTIDKMEQAIRSQTPGMVKTETITGTSPSFNTTTEEPTLSVGSANTVIKETVLNVTGDEIYTLVEETETGETTPVRSVKKESIEQLVRELSEPSQGLSFSTSGDVLTMRGNMSFEFELGDPKLIYRTNLNLSGTINLNDPRCSVKTSTAQTSTIFRDGQARSSVNTNAKSSTACGRTLTRGELKAIDLANISLCDETTGDDEGDNCQYGQDLSYLVE